LHNFKGEVTPTPALFQSTMNVETEIELETLVNFFISFAPMQIDHDCLEQTFRQLLSKK